MTYICYKPSCKYSVYKFCTHYLHRIIARIHWQFFCQVHLATLQPGILDDITLQAKHRKDTILLTKVRFLLLRVQSLLTINDPPLHPCELFNTELPNKQKPQCVDLSG